MNAHGYGKLNKLSVLHYLLAKMQNHVEKGHGSEILSFM